VLIPRPSTATIAEEVIQHVRATHSAAGAKGDGLLIADVCTGSGCIAIALLKNLPGARAVATDVSADALDVAKENASRHAVADRLDLLQGDLLAPLLDYPATCGVQAIDYFVCNPPYIPDHEWPTVAPNVKDYEPHSALRGGADGLDFLRRLLDGGPRLVKAGGLMLIEIAACTAEEATEMMLATGEMEDVRVLKDIEGLPRVVVGRRVGR
jgi:release factor glutamine methyltransferase